MTHYSDSIEHSDSFVLTKDTLILILKCAHDRLHKKRNKQIFISYRAYYIGGNNHDMSDLIIDNINNIDNIVANIRNTRKNRLAILYVSMKENDPRSRSQCDITFGGHEKYSITAQTISSDHNWSRETSRQISEQIDLSLTRSKFYSIISNFKRKGTVKRIAIYIPSMISLLFLSFMLTRILTHTGKPSIDTMWLSETDVTSISEEIAKKNITNTTQIDQSFDVSHILIGVLKIQLSHINETKLSRDTIEIVRETIGMKKLWGILPILVIIFIIFVLWIEQCHERHAYCWGDCEILYRSKDSWHKRCIEIMVSVIILGVIVNLASAFINSS